MTINILPTAGTQNLPGMIASIEFMSQSTSTTPQALSVLTDCSCLGAGTATGSAARNLYTLAAGEEGQIKWIGFGSGTAATGEASVVFTGTATGQSVIASATDFLKLEFTNDVWYIRESGGATIATTT